jgi:hypothetical protein
MITDDIRIGETPLSCISGVPEDQTDYSCDVSLGGIWDAFTEWNFWFRNLNWTPLNFLKPSSQVNNFTVFFHFFIGM